MSHERTLIRKAAKAALLGQTAAASRVFVSRMGPAKTDELPALYLYANDEDVEENSANSAPRELFRKVMLSIECWQSAAGIDPEQLEDSFDDIALQIETAMDFDPTLADTASWEWISSTVSGISNDGNRPMGCIKLTYSCPYRTFQRTAARDAALPALSTIDVKTKVTPDLPATNQAEDVVTFTP